MSWSRVKKDCRRMQYIYTAQLLACGATEEGAGREEDVHLHAMYL